MREATKEELEKSFEECIESAKGLITKAMNEGDTPLVSPSVFLIMRKVPDPKNNPLPVAFKPLGDHDAPIESASSVPSRSHLPVGIRCRLKSFGRC